MSFKSSVYFQIYGDIWKLHKSYYNTQDNEDFWDKLIQSASEVYKKYEGKPEFEFAKQLALGVVDELDRSYRRNGGDVNEKQCNEC